MSDEQVQERLADNDRVIAELRLMIASLEERVSRVEGGTEGQAGAA